MRTLARHSCTVGLLASVLVLGCRHVSHKDDPPEGCTYVCVRHAPDEPSVVPPGSAPVAKAPAAPALSSSASVAPGPVPKAPAYLPAVTSVCPGDASHGQPYTTMKMPLPPPAGLRPGSSLPAASGAARTDLPKVNAPPRPVVLPAQLPPSPCPACAPCDAAIQRTPPPAQTVRSFSVREEPMPSRTFVDAGPGGLSFGHAPDYTWLRGEVEQSHRGIRLRYAPVDEVDPYGGSVTLVGDTQVEGLRDGQCVRVRGQLLNPDARTSAPAYRVLSVEAAGR